MTSVAWSFLTHPAGFLRQLRAQPYLLGTLVSVTREFLKHFRQARPSQATIVRTYASVRHFARWIHQTVRPFPLGCPTDGIKSPQETEPGWKGLSLISTAKAARRFR